MVQERDQMRLRMMVELLCSKPLNEKMDIGTSSTDSVKSTTGNRVLNEILIHSKFKRAKKVVKTHSPTLIWSTDDTVFS